MTRVDLLDEAIRPYLSTIGRGSISEEQSKTYITQLYLTGYLEGMGAILVKNIMPQARKLVTEDFSFEEKELAQLQDLADKSGELFTMAMEAFDKKSYEPAEQVTQLYNKYARLGKKLYQDHFATLRTNTEVPLEHSSVYLDTIDKMVSLTSQISTIAGTIIEEL
jgi:phosphate:Na+ symporter